MTVADTCNATTRLALDERQAFISEGLKPSYLGTPFIASSISVESGTVVVSVGIGKPGTISLGGINGDA